MKANRVSLRTLGAILCGTLALWASAGALAIAGLDVHAPRVGLLPSPWWLLAALAAASIASFVIRAAHQRPTALWLTGLLLLPWLPIPVPAAALVWAGPLRFWLFALIA